MIPSLPGMRRALWITRFDWNNERELRALVDSAIDAGVTDLLTQVRGAGDALYRSDVAPLSLKIASRLGGDVAWDPLAVVCEMARKRDEVRVHAWLNVLSGWPATSHEACAGLGPSPGENPDHLLIRQPEALLVDAQGRAMPCPNATDYLWVSPRHPTVVAELLEVVDELTARYPLAGIHLDRIRYPEGDWFEPESGIRSTDAVSGIVRHIRDQLSPEVELTAALVPDYGRRVDDGEREHLSVFGQDGWQWVADGLVDSVMPMIYTSIREGASDDWGHLVDQHLAGVQERHCWIPLYAELDEGMLQQQVATVKDRPNAGIAWYSAGLIDRHARWSLVREMSAFG